MLAICRITLPQLGHDCQDFSDTKIVENHNRMAGVLNSYSECLELHILFRRVFEIAKSDCFFVMSVRPSVRPLGTTRLPPDGFSWSLIFEYFSKICRENSSFVKTWRGAGGMDVCLLSMLCCHVEISTTGSVFAQTVHESSGNIDSIKIQI